MTPSRETILTALLAKFNPLKTAAQPVPNGFVFYLSRRLRTWDQSMKPALYLVDMHENYKYQSENLQKIVMQAHLFFYFDAGNDPEVVPSTTLNAMLDAIDACLAPDNGDDKCTLGGLVSHCYVSGELIKVSGDLDGEGMAVIPLEILVP